MSSALFSPISIGQLTLKNRIMVSPMCQYSAIDGLPTEWHPIHLGSMAISGAGLVTVEATAVSPEGRITPQCLGLWSDRHAEALAPVIASVRAVSDTPLSLQIGHAGRKASAAVPWEGGRQIGLDAGGWDIVGPMAEALREGERAPAALDEEGIGRIVTAFADTARRAAELGFDMLELHGGHGYLISSFVSPITNRRNDSWGGSLENRIRLPLEILRAVRAVWPAERPIGVRINGTDFAEGGSTIEDVLAYAAALKAAGADLVTASGGGVTLAQKITPAPGYQLPAAARIRAETEVTTCAVGMIHDAHQAEAIIAEGKADMVALARAMLFNPRWPLHAALALGEDAAWPNQYERAAPRAWPLAKAS